MVKLNLKDIKAFEKLPTGKFNFEVKEVVEDEASTTDEELLRVKAVVIDDDKYKGCPAYMNFSPESDKSLPYLVNLLKACGISDKAIESIDDSSKIADMIVGKKFTARHKADKEFNWGKLSSLVEYEG